MLDFSRLIPELEKRRIVSQATFKAGEKGKITADSLLKACNDLEQQYLRRPLKRYQVVGSISFDKNCTLKRYTISGCSIRFLPRLSKAFDNGYERILHDARRSFIGDPSKDYIYLKKCSRNGWDKS